MLVESLEGVNLVQTLIDNSGSMKVSPSDYRQKVRSAVWDFSPPLKGIKGMEIATFSIEIYKNKFPTKSVRSIASSKSSNPSRRQPKRRN